MVSASLAVRGRSMISEVLITGKTVKAVLARDAYS